MLAQKFLRSMPHQLLFAAAVGRGTTLEAVCAGAQMFFASASSARYTITERDCCKLQLIEVDTLNAARFVPAACSRACAEAVRQPGVDPPIR